LERRGEIGRNKKMDNGQWRMEDGGWENENAKGKMKKEDIQRSMTAR
jgi:hypothetical protein